MSETNELAIAALGADIELIVDGFENMELVVDAYRTNDRPSRCFLEPEQALEIAEFLITWANAQIEKHGRAE